MAERRTTAQSSASVGIAPEQIPAVLAAGDDHAALHSWDAAEAAYAEVLAQAPEHAQAHRGLAAVYAYQQRHDEAERHYRAAIVSSPGMTDLYPALGDACRAQGKTKAALSAYNRCLAFDVDPRRIARARAGIATLAERPHKVCRRCGRFTTLSSFGGGRRGDLCPRCHAGATKRRRAYWWILPLLLLLIQFALTVIVDPDRPMAWAPLVNTVLIIVLTYAMVLPHELAHALVAWALGGKVYELRLGVGPVVWERQVGRLRLSLSRYPTAGYCTLAYPSRSHIQLRTLLSTMAGLLLSGLVVAALYPYYNGDRLVLDYAVLEVLVIVNGALLFFNLVPRQVSLGWARSYSDGALLLRALMGKTSAEAQHLRYFLLEGQYALRQQRWERAINVCRDGLLLYPESALLKNVMGVAYLEAGRASKAVGLFQEILADWENEREGRHLAIDTAYRDHLQAFLLNNLAAAMVALDDATTDLNGARDLSHRAYEMMPWYPEIESTWGSVLVRLGHARLGLAYLCAAISDGIEDSEPRTRASALAYMALAYEELGERNAADACMTQAVALAADHYSVRQVQMELGARSSAGVEPKATVPASV